MDYLQYKGFRGSIEYSEEDDMLCGRLLVKGDLISYEGETVKALEKDFHEAVDGYLDICQKQGRTVSPAEDDEIGVSLPLSLYKKALQYAEKQGISPEELMETALREYLEEQ